MRLLVTGGAGFIGTNFVRYVHSARPDWHIRVLDKLTYAGRRENLQDLEGSGRYQFVRGDICDPVAVRGVMSDVDAVVNFAAETHVDRSIMDAGSFVRTDIEGVWVLLEELRRGSPAGDSTRFIQISTDEVYGSVEQGLSKESDQLRPTSPYSASKAGGELLAMAYFHTHGVAVTVTRSSNNYGPWQYPEKLIPLFITNALEGQPLPLYGDGGNRRDWLYVEDQCAALLAVLEKGTPGAVYNIGGGQELENSRVARAIVEATGASEDLIRLVADRPGHDRRYGLDCSRVRTETGWHPVTPFEEGLARTVEWYRENVSWWSGIKSGEFRKYYESMYGGRLSAGRGPSAGGKV
ncbi:dTDP-glucose 4,6-dehydratase [Candidatus Fermentibacterales bacterium]|nr:dTDP-glucose 4,6-dehydratase [Candidatus Fermentibacterales bacterium]